MNQTKLISILANLVSTTVAFLISGGVIILWLVGLRCLALWKWEWYPGDWGIFFRTAVVFVLLILWIFLWRVEPTSSTKTN